MILTGPEIKRLATPCTIDDLKRGEWVYLNGMPAEVLAKQTGPSPARSVFFRDGRRESWHIDPATLLTRTRPDGARLIITPFNPALCGPASYDLHMGDELRVYRSVTPWDAHIPIAPKSPPETRRCPWSDVGYGPFWQLDPGRVYLVSTREYTETHYLAAQVGGRSSIGRCGLFVHVTAGFIDPGFCGRITLELVATQPVIVRPGDRIAQIVYSTITGEYQPYKGRYRGNTGPTASRFHWSDEEVSRAGD